MTQQILLLSVLFLIVAGLYSSVGLGGGSSYVAILALFPIAPEQIPSTALALNIIVAGLAFWSYWRKGEFNRTLSIPFLLTSVPAAFAGGLIPLTAQTLELFLAGVLLPTGVFLFIRTRTLKSDSEVVVGRQYSVSSILGVAIGFLGGITGIGGGVFLIPILLLLRYAPAKEVSSLAAAFVLLNSIAALSAHFVRSNVYPELILPLLGAVTVGGLIGSRLGAAFLSQLAVRRLAGVVVLLASLQILYGLI